MAIGNYWECVLPEGTETPPLQRIVGETTMLAQQHFDSWRFEPGGPDAGGAEFALKTDAVLQLQPMTTAVPCASASIQVVGKLRIAVVGWRASHEEPAPAPRPAYLMIISPLPDTSGRPLPLQPMWPQALIPQAPAQAQFPPVPAQGQVPPVAALMLVG
jgi:hypothetical protein